VSSVLRLDLIRPRASDNNRVLPAQFNSCSGEHRRKQLWPTETVPGGM
jgi:hypothetical protein